VLTCCWSVKGGSGTTVVAASLALLAASAPGGALLVDLAGDIPAALGLPQPSGPGLRDWLSADAGVEADAIGHLSEPATPGLRVVPAGADGGDHGASRARVELLARTLAEQDTETVVDIGVRAPVWQPLLARADTSLLVIRPCYMALRRAASLTTRPTGIVLVREPGRALGRREVEDVTGVRVLAEIDVEPSIARAVDAGLLASRLPRGLARPLRAAT
jgi:MinD-like ATPase involved in chromosome partitioning or flagellar assembly